MPRQKGGQFDNRKYQNEYHRNMKKKLISFNQNSAEDMLIWDYLEGKGNVTRYIKELIKKEMGL